MRSMLGFDKGELAQISTAVKDAQVESLIFCICFCMCMLYLVCCGATCMLSLRRSVTHTCFLDKCFTSGSKSIVSL